LSDCISLIPSLIPDTLPTLKININPISPIGANALMG